MISFILRMSKSVTLFQYDSFLRLRWERNWVGIRNFFCFWQWLWIFIVLCSAIVKITSRSGICLKERPQNRAIFGIHSRNVEHLRIRLSSQYTWRLGDCFISLWLIAASPDDTIKNIIFYCSAVIIKNIKCH